MRAKAWGVLAALAAASCGESEHVTPAASASVAPAHAASAAIKTVPEVPVTTTSRDARMAFEKGLDFELNGTREAEAQEAFKKAVELDAGFAYAHAWLGYLAVGGDGGKSDLDLAMSARDKLPEPERLSIEELKALKSGDRAKATELSRRIVELAPFDWRAQLDLGNRLYDARKFDEATAHYAKAAAFGPNTPPVYNALGYGYLAQHKVDAAVAAFRKYAELKPDEPNALDSLGEALMNGGKLAEAETAFQASANRGFSFAWDGVAQTRFLRGDWAAGLEANSKSREGAERPVDKLDVDTTAVWATLASGDLAAANKRIDALEKDAQAAKYEEASAMVSVLRGLALSEAGKDAEASKELAHAVERGEKAKLPGNAMARVKRWALGFQAIVEAKSGSPDAEKTGALLEEEAKKSDADLDLASLAALGRGAALLAKGDAKSAVVALAACVDQDYLCRYGLLLAEEKVPDATSASVTRDTILAMNLRDPPYLYVRAKAGGATAAPPHKPDAK